MSTSSGFFTGDGTPRKMAHRAQAYIQIQQLAQRHIQGADPPADGRCERTFDADQTLLKRGDRLVGQPCSEPVERRLSGIRLAPCDFSPAAVRLLHSGVKDRLGGAAKMSGPVPSPRIKGMIGLSGTLKPPPFFAIRSPAFAMRRSS